ncbi:WhiB family transcriptional regulator [Streptomyces sp. NPDC001717]|uniref:WhiB family transcriptional regulator n=1 Tax=Streptomyces sp. NPDC001717 TaxID=3364604 RepID=UPI0036B10FAB
MGPVVQHGRSEIERGVSAAAPELSAPACRNADPGLFFPAYGRQLRHSQVIAAKELCTGCPVQEECLAMAVHADESDGIWGGTTPVERRRMRSQLARMQCGAELARSVVREEDPRVPLAERPGVVHNLLRMGWNAERIRQTLKLTADQVEEARVAAARAQALHALMERHYPQGWS